MKEIWTEFWKALKEAPRLYIQPIRPGILFLLTAVMTVVAIFAILFITTLWAGMLLVYHVSGESAPTLPEMLGETLDLGLLNRVAARWFWYFDGKL